MVGSQPSGPGGLRALARRNMLFEIQIFVPIADNLGTEFVAEQGLFEEKMLFLFGGFSLYPGLVHGGWLSELGVAYRDQLRVYGISVKGLQDGTKITALAEFAKTLYRQEAIFVR